jgi:hypothetical protein
MSEKITAQLWNEQYLIPFASDETLQEVIDGYGGFAGWVLDGVLATKDIDGEEATDHDCLELISELVSKYLDATERGIDTQ